ncbi:MAG: DUF4838 domain-containing protein [Pirellulaceae bacterium]|jgi:hypothetical protein|nr:DUF4838 domain-containing protein [Pirellulaceae bacterium]HJN12826.1 DUF4838 domain-containing protein [Pirellulaceae bacterium]
MRTPSPLFYCIVSLIFLAGSASAESRERVTLARAGKSSCVIVQADNATEPEKFAAKELATFLKRVTGAEFPIAAEQLLTDDRASRIYVGWTRYATRRGVDTSKLGEEEWVIRTIDDDLVLTGGRPRGTMYAVYEFLEDHVGCHWPDRKTEVIPSKPTLEVGPLNIQAEPHFWQRQLHSPTGSPDNHWLFLVRNRNYRYDFKGRAADGFFPQGAFSRISSPRTSIHSFSTFVNGKDWFDSHPEYFSLVGGNRVPALTGAGPGQLCLTHPDVLRMTVAKLREFIKADRAEATANGFAPPKVYSVTQNDIYRAHCECDNCQAIATREGGESGPLVAFLNAVAKDIEKDYPNILVGTLAYNLTSTPPKHIRPRNNVLIGWCDVYSKVDGIRPLSHPLNARNYGEITGWGKVAPRLAIGDDYWTALAYYKYFPTPYAMIDCVAKDIKLFADQGAESFFAETPDYVDASQQFIPLKFWLGYQLLVDPQQPAEPLIKTFMDGYFGEASDPMREYLRYLRKRIDVDAQFKKLRDEPHKLAYLDLEFFKTAQTLFDKAESRVEAASLEAKQIAVERFTLDGALLFLWPWLERKLPAGETMPFDRVAVIQRYERGWKTLVSSRYSRIYTQDKNSFNADGKMLQRMLSLFRNSQLPDQFRDLPPRDVADFNWLTFSQITPRQKLVPDPDAVGGMTATFTVRNRIQRAEEGGTAAENSDAEQHRKPLVFGTGIGKRLSDKKTITIRPEDIPQDGKYHLYPLGRIRVQEGTTVWALEGGRLGVNVDRVVDRKAKTAKANEWNAYISLKLQGPAYVKGSKDPNGAWMDRVVLVSPQ